MNKLNVKEVLWSIKDSFRNSIISKINEIIDYLNGIGTGAKKEYVALVSQTGLNAPTAVVIKNTLGFTPTFRYDGVGEYAVVSSGKWVSGKTACYVTNSQASNGNIMLSYTDTNDLYLATPDTTTGSTTNGILQSSTIKIEIYN